MTNEVEMVQNGPAPAWNRAEVDNQVATARQFPRDLAAFKKDMTQLVEILKPDQAAGCEYCVPVGRDKQGIQQWHQGPSVRFAELVFQHWGNLMLKVGSDTDHQFAYGIVQVRDMQTNRALEVRIPRPITGKRGKFPITVIKNICLGAQSIAFREAIYKMVPKLLWQEFYDAVMDKSIPADWESRRVGLVKSFERWEVSRDQVLGALEVAHEDQITKQKYRLARALYSTLNNAEAQPRELFPAPGRTQVLEPTATDPGAAGLGERMKQQAGEHPEGDEPAGEETEKPGKASSKEDKKNKPETAWGKGTKGKREFDPIICNDLNCGNVTQDDTGALATHTPCDRMEDCKREGKEK